MHPDVLQRSRLAEPDREYSLYEICIITRSGPARILGLTNKGHLAPGADADVTIIDPDAIWTPTKECFQSRSTNTPFIGQELRGRATDVLVGGEFKLKSTHLVTKGSSCHS